MVPIGLILEHAIALLAVWAMALIAGIPTCAVLRLRLGFPGYALMGIVYWAVSLYVFAFDGGLWVALALAGATCVATLVQRGRRYGWRAWRREAHWSGAILFLGGAVYATLILANYVPIAVDGGMVTTSTRLVAAHRGLPATYDPMLPELFFPAINLAMPTVGSIPVALGCKPGSVTLGLAQLTYSAWILATYLVLRLWTRPLTAAVLAVAQAWGARWAQNTIGWGGFPTVAGMAVGLLAVRLMWDATRRRSPQSAIALGLATGAIPLVHGISAAVWMYAAAPVVGLTVLTIARKRAAAFMTLLAASLVSVLVLGCYVRVAQVNMSESEIEWSRGHLCEDLPPESTGLRNVLDGFDYFKRFTGSMIVWLGVFSTAGLLLFRRWRTALALCACMTLLWVIYANARWWVLPFSLMLYPNRTVYWAGPLAAVALGLLWKASRRQFPLLGNAYVGMVAGVVLLTWMFSQHVIQYQRPVWIAAVDRDRWEALCWAEKHLTAPGTFVQVEGDVIGAVFPGCAGVACNVWQVNHCALDEKTALLASRPRTHRVWVRGVDPTPRPTRSVVFQNETVVITVLESAVAQNAAPATGR